MATEEGATPTQTVEPPTPQPPVTPEPPKPAEPPVEPPVPGEEALGDPGKKALDAMKAERNTARQEAKAAHERIAELEKQIGEKPKGDEVNEQVTDLTSKLSDTTSKLIDAEVRAAAAGRFQDPGDVLKFLDRESILTDGAPDAEKITAELSKLGESKSYLLATGNQWGSADAGARKAPQVETLSAEDVRQLHREGKHAVIAAAQREGRIKVTD